MVMRQLKLGSNFEMALETSIGRSLRIHDCPRTAATLDVQASRSMARFAPHALSVLTLYFQPSVSRGAKVFRDRFVTGFAGFRADEFRAGNTGRRQHCPIGSRATG